VTEAEKIRGALWSVFEDLREGDITDDESESLVSCLDSLVELLRIETLQARRASSPHVPARRLS
jgi:hypothetical protein